MNSYSVKTKCAHPVENRPVTDVLFPNQVYKVVVQWSNGSSTVIYRRYSMFFDFLVGGLYSYLFGIYLSM